MCVSSSSSIYPHYSDTRGKVQMWTLLSCQVWRQIRLLPCLELNISGGIPESSPRRWWCSPRKHNTWTCFASSHLWIDLRRLPILLHDSFFFVFFKHMLFQVQCLNPAVSELYSKDSQEVSMESRLIWSSRNITQEPLTFFLLWPLLVILSGVMTQVSQHFSDTPGIHATVGSHVGLTAPVNALSRWRDCKETRRERLPKGHGLKCYLIVLWL